MAENDDPPAPDAAARPSPALPRRNLSSERQPSQPPGGDIEERFAHLVDSVASLATQIVGDPGAAPDPAKDKSGRRVKRFQRTGTVDDRSMPISSGGDDEPADPAAQEPAAPPRADARRTGGAEFNKNVAWPRISGGDAAPVAAEPARPPSRKRPSKRVVLLAVQVAGISLLVLGFLAGRGSVAPAGDGDSQGEAIRTAKAPDGGGSSRVSERTLQTANAALHAARSGDAKGARKIFQDAVDHHAALAGTYYQLARLDFQNNDRLGGDVNLDRSTEAGEFVAACCYLQARLSGLKGNYSEAARALNEAAHTDPFNGRYFFYWAEALRRRGQPLQAIEVFEQALDRAHTRADGELYLFKQRLAKVEAGNDGAFNAELNENLRQEPAAAEWCLLAAARDINRSAFPAAAEFLKKAAGSMPPPKYALRVKDYLFRSVENEPVLTGLLRNPVTTDSEQQNERFTDPIVLPPELADPAIWWVPAAKPRPRS